MPFQNIAFTLEFCFDPEYTLKVFKKKLPLKFGVGHDDAFFFTAISEPTYGSSRAGKLKSYCNIFGRLLLDGQSNSSIQSELKKPIAARDAWLRDNLMLDAIYFLKKEMGLISNVKIWGGYPAVGDNENNFSHLKQAS